MTNFQVKLQKLVEKLDINDWIQNQIGVKDSLSFVELMTATIAKIKDEFSMDCTQLDGNESVEEELASTDSDKSEVGSQSDHGSQCEIDFDPENQQVGNNWHL